MKYPFTLFSGPTFAVIEIAKGRYQRSWHKSGKVENAVGYQDNSIIVKWSETEAPMQFDHNTNFVLIVLTDIPSGVVLMRWGIGVHSYFKQDNTPDGEILKDGDSKWRKLGVSNEVRYLPKSEIKKTILNFQLPEELKARAFARYDIK